MAVDSFPQRVVGVRLVASAFGQSAFEVLGVSQVVNVSFLSRRQGTIEQQLVFFASFLVIPKQRLTRSEQERFGLLVKVAKHRESALGSESARTSDQRVLGRFGNDQSGRVSAAYLSNEKKLSQWISAGN